MKYTHKSISLILTRILPLVLLANVIFSCTGDYDDIENSEDYTGTPVSVAVNIATKANTGVYAAPVDPEDLIAKYRIAFAQTNGRIVAIVDNTCAPTEKDPFEVRLSPGTYNVYAFANMDGNYLDELGIIEGNNIPSNIKTLRYHVPGHFSDGKLLAKEDLGGYIPMTGICPQRIQITERVNQTFNVEVRRLFAKIQFDYTNKTKTKWELRSQSIHDLTVNATDGNGSILLMNYEEGRDQLSLLTPAPKATLSHTYTTPLTLNAEGGEASQTFYVLESEANSLTNCFMMEFNVALPKSEDSDENIRYSLTDPSVLTLIHRNDWIRIPVTLADWLLHLEVLFYPPIGGYPGAEIKEDGTNEFTVSFASGGDFIINPTVYRYDLPEDKFSFTDTRRVLGTPTITTTGDISIFEYGKQPRFTDSGEILGTLSNSFKGTACVTVSMDIITNPGVTPAVIKKLTRKIYLHHTR